MVAVLLSSTAVLIVWSLLAGRLQRWRITAPMVMVLGGVVIGASTTQGLTESLNTELAEQIAEVILALVLFVDSFEIRGRVFGHEPGLVARLLFVALPLSLVGTFAAAYLLLPDLPWPALLALACVVVPTDFAPAAGILKDERIPERVRNLLNIESGYNDGVVAPIFVFALTLAGTKSHASTPSEALAEAVPASLKAIAVGVVVGVVAGWLMRLAARHHLATSASLRVAVMAVPLLTLGLAMAVHGNGFVAAFVCGIAFRAARGAAAHHELDLAEDVAHLTGLAMWFVLGQVAVVVIAVAEIPWQMWLLAFVALTLARIVPVLLSLLGSSLPWRDRLLVSYLGPRGIATIVFGLLAFNALPDDPSAVAQLSMLVLVVVGSMLVHGLAAPFVASAYTRLGARRRVESGA